MCVIFEITQILCFKRITISDCKGCSILRGQTVRVVVY